MPSGSMTWANLKGDDVLRDCKEQSGENVIARSNYMIGKSKQKRSIQRSWSAVCMTYPTLSRAREREKSATREGEREKRNVPENIFPSERKNNNTTTRMFLPNEERRLAIYIDTRRTHSQTWTKASGRGAEDNTPEKLRENRENLQLREKREGKIRAE